MARERQVWGLTMAGPRGGMVLCGGCGRMIAYVAAENCAALYLHSRCRCGEDGWVKLRLPKERPRQFQTAELYRWRVRCPLCGRELLILSEGGRGFALEVHCVCGGAFNRVRPVKRQVYRELNLTPGQRSD